ncbi:50S ribosomal protein L16 [Trichoplax sp. H2]|uniref:Large ribosomal subunit protein uL16m n=1 Tax=Trichoplax adhaerens TaxID=10228 RepID=B3S6N0_TRIAD|nr:hypothetical protein TRIADDRAFT_59863 [Trichoplax adhaerens]EDV21650.1 hypothetical protein TRIADDRAFT_59863 [Trichoplax adhaerens]RDD47437.1 50S ribosomal protein L16 [Trichoplax sp. H2]|eukprot:XP_002115798.1 hypothetical protein TRIADDRAFT_59863 [Trichoplax adhaerens]
MSILQTSLLSSFLISTKVGRNSLLQPFQFGIRHLKVRIKPPQPKLSEIKWKFDDNMDYGIYSASSGYIKEASFEAGRVAIRRLTNVRNFWVAEATVPVTKKGIGSRMGKGKGKLHHYVKIVKPGDKLFEFDCNNEYLARAAFRAVTFKLPVRTKLRIRPNTQSDKI